jgi:uncharacterized protein (UPF0276 family)
MNFADLEPLGVGLAADVAGDKPNFRLFMDDAKPDERIRYLNVGATHVQLPRVRRHIDDLVQAGFPMIFHPVTFNPIDSLADAPEVERGNADIASYTRARWAGQDAGAWTWNGQYLGQFLLPAVFDAESASEVAAKVALIEAALPCPFAIENPPVTFSVESMHVLDFIAQVSLQADCGIVLDVGHLMGYQHATGRAAGDMPLDRFPFERVIEIHLAGLQESVSGDQVNYLDRHDLPITEASWTFLREMLPRMRNLKGFTLEQEFCEDGQVRQHLRRAHALLREVGLFA